MKILINASNLHTGGGIQVAASVIHELSLMNQIDLRLSVLVSDLVHANLQAQQTNYSKFTSYRVLNTNGISSLWSGFGRLLIDYDAVFTIFGPLYLLKKQKLSIVGFAQAWIIYPNNESYETLSFIGKFKTRLMFSIKKYFFKKANQLIVELEHVKFGLIERLHIDSLRINVVHNCINSIFFQKERWINIEIDRNSQNYAIGLITRDYSHKNVDILPAIKYLLQSDYRLDVDFFVTFTDIEWKRKSIGFRAAINNVGALNVVQCPSFYQQMNAVIFPSLLECFSATPLEAMIMEKPLFASDRRFVRDVCGPFAHYFDPKDPHDVAKVIAGYIKNIAGHDAASLSAAKKHVFEFSNARQRAESYLKIITELVDKNTGKSS